MTNTIKIHRGRYPDEEQVTVMYEKREDGWYVSTQDIDGKDWRWYALESARPIDVRQLLNKEYDARY